MKISTKKIIILSPLIAFFVIYFSLLIFCVSNSNNFNAKESDCIIVLGYSMDDDNPSEYLTYRLTTALDLYNKGYADNIIVTGGKGPTDSIPVANSMENWFIENGVPDENIFAETRANNTYENFVFSKQICDENNFNDVIVVTNDFHMFRSMIMANEFFDSATGKEAITPMSFKKVLAYLKEPLSLIKYEFLLKGKSDKILEKNDLEISCIENEHFSNLYCDNIYFYNINLKMAC